ncbi:unnamed protein product [Fraxinus pennsylvanica]|uniref:BHLH domain-containing protein n=1 Tax=Fraxinus pennsylvanica TaxID=56036 RepID=A0AAD1YMB8_9LAMI|nr:unnamed protein product [Fraxinus pennsylvanica]
MAAFSSFQFDSSVYLPNSPINKMCGSLEEITNTRSFLFYEQETLQNLDQGCTKISTPISNNEPSLSHVTNKNISMDNSSSITEPNPIPFIDNKKRKLKVVSPSNSAQSKDTREAKIKKPKKCKEVEEKKKTKKDEKKAEEEAPTGYIHVRARRGQATDSHSLAERVRRERISERMKLLQTLVPGCDKVTGKAPMLDEIINYVQSLQNQVEFLSMKLASANPMLHDFGMDLESFMVRPDQNLRGAKCQISFRTEMDSSCGKWMNKDKKLLISQESASICVHKCIWNLQEQKREQIKETN